MFGFGNYDPSSSKLVTNLNMDQLKDAPINNLDPERSVASIQHGLGIYGRSELNAAGSAHLKGKSYDLIELKPRAEFLKHKSKVKRMNMLVQDWKSKQSELQIAGLSKKEALAITTDKRKNRALLKLRAFGGPFVHCEEVDEFISDQTIPEKVKQDRLYTEVQYARDTTLSLPKDSNLFRLKEKYKNLPLM